MTPLQSAMRLVAGQDADARAAVVTEAERMLAEADAAHQAEAAVEAAPEPASEPTAPPVDFDAELRAVAADAARKEQERAADAIRVVLREKARYGHDLTALRPHEAQAVKIIEGALMAVGGGSVAIQEDAFNSVSSPAEIAKGAAVGAIINQSSTAV